MAFDVIVFNQDELLRALEAGAKSIALCDNSFSLPDTEGIHYTIIGDVTIEGMDAPKHSEDKSSEQTVEEIPAYANVENKPQSLSSSFDSSFAGSFGGSYGTAQGGGSYGAGSGASYQSSYTYEYEYETGGSFAGSFASSFTSSYMSLYASSFETSFASSFYSFISGMSFEWSGSYGFGGSFGFGFGYSFEFGASFGYMGSYGFGGSYEYFGSYAGSYDTSFNALSGYSGSGGSYALPDIIEYGSSGIIFVNGYGINLI